MAFGLAHDARGYEVDTPVYSGPLDLLLQLIERAELEITTLALAQVTGQYLAYLDELQVRSPEELSAFMVIAARLVQIKSEALLPRPRLAELQEEDPAEALARQLLAYKRYKEIAGLLGERESAGLKTYPRGRRTLPRETKIDLDGVSLEDFCAAAQAVFSPNGQPAPLESVVAAPKITIREKIRLIIDSVRTAGKARFSDILRRTHSRLEIVVSFLALLELVKSRRVAASQEEMFNEITIEPAAHWGDAGQVELEFGE